MHRRIPNKRDRSSGKPAQVSPASSDIGELFAAASVQHQSGALAEAERDYRRILALDPDHAASLHRLGVLLHQMSRAETALELLARAVALAPVDPEYRYGLGVALGLRGRFDEAIAQYREAVRLKPDYIEAEVNLGNAYQQMGKLAEAASCYERAIALRPDQAETHCNLGNVRAQQRRHEPAIAAFERALALRPMLAEAQNGRAVSLLALGRAGDAAAALEQALAINPQLAEAHVNLGNICKQRGEVDAAASRYERALALRPDLVETHNNLGLLRLAQGRLDAARTHFRRAIALRPDFIDAYDNLARIHLSERQPGPALDVLRQALAIREHADTRTLLVQGLRDLDTLPEGAEVEALVGRALAELWVRPNDLANVAAALIKRDPAIAGLAQRANAAWPARLRAAELFGAGSIAAIAANRLLRLALPLAPLADIVLERLLTAVRHALLEIASTSSAEASAPEALELAGLLARQCFINDYAFDDVAAEHAQAAALRDRLGAALVRGAPVPPLWIAVLAAYQPLAALPGIDALLGGSWPKPVDELLTQQVREPRDEQSLAVAIPQLTPIDDDVSRKVREQYEENPYPRWVKLPADAGRVELEAHLREKFPLVRWRSFGGSDDLRVLIAGCGTGRHPIDFARRFACVRVLAVDLSRASLAYAARKTNELAISNIDYAQADLLRIDALPDGFDVIHAVGVLHHLSDPWAGWRALLSRLKPDGVMLVGLYSERARADVSIVRDFLRARGDRATAEDIRRCRQELLGFPERSPQHNVTLSPDFHAIGDCRDLLFHAHEQQVTLPQIARFLGDNRLNLLGFDLAANVRRQYALACPNDAAMIDLGRWHQFEAEHPLTFVNMYQFWVQKRDAL
jgi:tetratricopeptide (TPR) repeat protein